MKTTKDLAVIGLYTALLIGGQLALSAISGVEIVTLLFTAFCFYFGRLRGMMVGTAFSILRIIVFGFFPSVLVLYLFYYNIFALVIGGIGRAMGRKLNAKNLIITVLCVAFLTVFFTALDNVITPIFYSYSLDMAKSYWIMSLTTLIPQTICSVVSVSLLFIPLVKIFEKISL